MSVLAKLSMRNRALIALVTVVVAIFGGIALNGLKQELAPSIQLPQLTIITAYPGASPDVVDADVSTPVETAIQGITGLESTSTTSSTGISRVTASFTFGTDLAFAEQKLLSAVNRVAPDLPEDVEPQVVAFSFDDLPVLAVAVTGAEDPATLSDELTRTTLPEIRDIDGVRDAALVGDQGRRVVITPDPAQLAAYGLTPQTIRDSLQQSGVLLPAGEITEGDSTFAVQAGTRLGSVDDIAALPILGGTQPAPVEGVDGELPGATDGETGQLPGGDAGTDGGTGTDTDSEFGAEAPTVVPVALSIGDVATVALTENPQTSISRVNGEPALAISVTKLPAANTVEVSNAVRDALPDLQSALDTTNPGAEFTVVFDQAPYIERSIESLAVEGLLGLLFAVLVILVFLMSVRATLVTAISIPTSVLITFIGLQAADYTLNILTLGALTISIGRVVDDSIVVIENIKRHLVAGVEKAPTIVHAVREVAGAITASTITTVAVFLPIALVEGVTGELFRPFSLTVTIALLASLLVSLTIVPVLAYWFLKPAKPRAGQTEADAAAEAAFVDEVWLAPELRDADGGTGLRPKPVPDAAPRPAAVATVAPVDELEHPSRLQKGFLPILGWTLRHSAVTIIVAVLVLAGTVALAPLMKTNFLGSSGQNTFRVVQELPVGSSLEYMATASVPVEDAIRGVDGVEVVQTSIGSTARGVLAAFSAGGSSVTYNVTTDEDADQDALQAEVRAELEDLEDVGDVTVSAQSGFGASNDIEVDITASNAEDLAAATDAVVAELGDLDSLSQVTSNLDESRPYIAVEVDRAKAAAVGYSEVALGGIVSGAMQPQAAGSIVIEEQTLTIYLAGETPPVSVAELQALPVPTPTGPVRLDSLATVAQVDGPASVTTVKGLRSATVAATPAGDDLGAASGQVQQAVSAVDLPAGTTASLGGVTADQQESFSQLGLALLAAILIVYVVMVATFRSLLQPLLLLVSVPFAATGAILLQIITGIPLGVASLVGVLMLVGIVVTNAIVLIDLVNQYRERGMTVRDALMHGASRRLRPILMTALATIFALLPLALGITGSGGFISQPLALVVIGGLFSSTLLTLLVLPSLYDLVEGSRERRRAKRATKRAEREGAEAEVARAAPSGSSTT
ncbi:HAE1 family hydrophobic/amphiphilic exporter-1 [Agromyces flavus]|uniref:HAE1 family hydrophobic/amphiphilic exporter-1 n=1 Tax=Agromyces flavus TaxID=589382 RepID=A0A1H1ZQQ0_9MICO|nr:efflux RND transporter permease subunit [Agromyces flavus]MCP2367209.1 HAE1 family hydrophobic/amphiphilic exporter-1 [Agromyces flavus]GGI46185.1 transporter [Agromyces flavus]SDT35897.1 hydrophobic/amphiphilic exporter-1, HAE1 family [Agromyces flavus]